MSLANSSERVYASERVLGCKEVSLASRSGEREGIKPSVMLSRDNNEREMVGHSRKPFEDDR